MITGTPVPFEGIHRNYYLKNLPAEAFLSVAAGKSVDVIVDLAALHDLSTGGAFDVATVGAIPTAKPGSTELSGGAVAFESNVLSIDVHGPTAAKVEKAINLEKRTVVQSGCTTSERSALLNALSNCAYFAKNAASAATSGSATKFSEYYKTTSSTTRSTVAARFQGVASQASTTTSGGTRYSCYDTYGYCSPNVLAYTLPSQNYIANCDLYYTLPAVASSCHEQDRATTSLHEFTHAPATYSPGTQDNAYGYSASTQLSSSAAVLNADTYALYANGKFEIQSLDCFILTDCLAIYLGC